jgi:hypothetical protein
MWSLENNTPFEAERCWVRDKNGAEVWLVAVRGTFDILQDGTLQVADKQEKVVMAPEFSGDPLRSGLLNDTDLPHKKMATDILLSGCAIAPNNQPVKTLQVGFKVGDTAKILQVTGNRFWRASPTGVRMSDIEPFAKLPITYERAYGGMDFTSEDPTKHTGDNRNPAGTGFAKDAEQLIGQPVLNIEYPNQRVTRWDQQLAVAGFGPIAGHWQPRVMYGGTYDEKWERTRQPLLAEDFDERYYQSAPVDQQVEGYLKGGETVSVINMSETGKLHFRLPKTSFAFTTHFFDGTSERHRAVINTVILKPNESKLVMVWHTHLECHFKVHKLNKTTIRLKERILLSERDQANAIV